MPTANGHNLVEATLTERLRGNWLARIEVDSEEALDPAVILDVDGVTWSGTVYRGAVDTGRYRATVVGGAGGLFAQVPALFYDSGLTLGTVIQDVLTVGGETLSPTSDAAVTGLVVPRYHRRKGTVAELLGALADRAGATWRVLRDGTVWIGVDTFPDLQVDDDDEIHDPIPDDDLIEIIPETPYVLPGVTYSDLQVAEVQTALAGKRLSQTLHGAKPTLESEIDARIERKLTYLRQYAAKVTAQNGGRVNVVPDDPRVAGRGLTGVPIRHGLPGVTVSLALGARVLLGFEGGDPSAPYVALWPDGSSVTGVTFAGDLTVGGDLTVAGDVGATNVDATAGVSAMGGVINLTTHTHNVTAPGNPSGPPVG